MNLVRATLLSAIGLLAAGLAFGQTITIAPAAGTATTIRAANYTVPAGGACTASGAWTASKTASGSDTFLATASGDVTWTCKLPTGTLPLRWTAPTLNTDGSALTNLDRYDVYCGTSPTTLAWLGAQPGTATSANYTVPTGNRCCAIKAAAGASPNSLFSEFSATVCADIPATTTTTTASVTVTTPAPMPPVLLSIDTVARTTSPDYTRLAFVPGATVVGSVPVGTVCDKPIADGYASVPLSFVAWSVPVSQRPKNVVVRCAL